MNEENIEALLRKAPAIKTPAGLADKLKRDIRLPRATVNDQHRLDSPSWLRRWLPAVSLAVFLIACVVAVGVQSNIISGLKADNEKLQAAGQNLEQLRADNAEYKKLLAASQDLDQLRKDNADLLRLRAEVEQLRAQVQEAEKLRTENHSLQTQIQAANTTKAPADFFDQAKANAERVQCMNQLKQIGIAERVWAGDYQDVLPTNYVCMSNELAFRWQLLQCPGDHSSTLSNWQDVAAGNVSYVMAAPAGTKDTDDPSTVFAYCPIHHNYLLIDGSVQHLSPEGVQKCIKTDNGVMKFTPTNP